MNATASPLDLFRAHGGKIEAARTLFPESPRAWIDLSTGISPWPWPCEGLLDRAAFTRLPDPEALAALERAASTCFGVSDARRVIALPGTDIGLRLLGPLFPEARVAVTRPGYSGHASAWIDWRGLAPRAVSWIADTSLQNAAREHDVIVLAHPGTPDGRTIRREELLQAARTLAARDGVLIVDEAYADADPALSVCSEPDLIVFRSFGKFFGLAGLRLGFAVVPSHHVPRFRHAVGDWPLNGPAIAIGTAAYLDTSWQQMQRDRLRQAAARLDETLKRAGLTIVGGTPLFRLARCANADALFRHLASHAILTRPFGHDLLRFGLPADEAQWDRLVRAFQARPL
jgi:cobalamin biosynthetic protein CobC